MTEAIGGAGRRRSACRTALAVRPEQPRKPGRPDDHRQAKPLSEESKRQIALGGTIERPRQQCDFIERLLIAPQSALIFRTAVGKIEYRGGQRTPRQRPHRGDAIGLPLEPLGSHAHARSAIEAVEANGVVAIELLHDIIG